MRILVSVFYVFKVLVSCQAECVVVSIVVGIWASRMFLVSDIHVHFLWLMDCALLLAPTLDVDRSECVTTSSK